MIRRSTIFSAIATVLFSGSVMAQVSVDSKLPATVAPGGSFTMELDVLKGDISGFAKLEQILPPGFSAEQKESANATFSFKDQKVKFLWMALPNGNFKLSYKVNVDASLSGNQIIEGTFSYIDGNETEKYIIPKDIISVGADQAQAAKQAAMNQILAEQQAKEDAANAAREEAGAEEVVAEQVVEKTVEVAKEAVQQVEEVAEEEVEYTEEVAYEEEPEVTQVYEEPVVKKAAPVVEKAAPVKKTVQAAPAPTVNYNDAMMKSKPGLVFRVQVAAGPNQVDPSFFVSKYGISEAVVIEEHEGLYKYVVGEFGSYRPAKTFSNELRDNNSVDGPFVTAYNDGVRIHVKEALEIAGH